MLNDSWRKNDSFLKCKARCWIGVSEAMQNSSCAIHIEFIDFFQQVALFRDSKDAMIPIRKNSQPKMMLSQTSNVFKINFMLKRTWVQKKF